MHDKNFFFILMAAFYMADFWMAASNLDKTPVFDSPPLPTQSVRLLLVTCPSPCSTCVTYKTPCHAIGHQVLHTKPMPREAEDFPRDDKYFKHVPLLTYLIYFSSKGYMW